MPDQQVKMKPKPPKLVEFKDEDGRGVFFDPVDVIRVWGCGGDLKGKATVLCFGESDSRIVRGQVTRVGRRIAKMQIERMPK